MSLRNGSVVGGHERKVSKPDLVSQSLIYPVRITTENTPNAGLRISINEDADIAQQALQVQLSDGTPIFTSPPDGGFIAIGVPINVWNPAGTACASLVPGEKSYVELPDGNGGTVRIWSGTNSPVSTPGQVIGTARAGDFFLRQRTGSVTNWLFVCTVGGSPGTWVLVD